MSGPLPGILEVNFAQPDAGWIDMKIATQGKSAEYPISNVYDPFSAGFIPWLEQLCEHGCGKLEIDIEGEFVELEVVSSGQWAFSEFICREGRTGQRIDLQATLPLEGLISTFYASVTEFWESDELHKNWREWVFPDELIDDQPVWDDDRPSKPWPIRSEKVERWLEGKP